MTTPSYDDIRKQIERRYSRIAWLIFHAVMAFFSILVIWIIDPTPTDGTPVLAVLWFGVLVCHAIKVFMDGLKDRAVERTWQRYAGEADDFEKPKRTLRLAEYDDEMEIVDDKVVDVRKTPRNQK